MPEILTTDLLNKLRESPCLDTFLETYEWSEVSVCDFLQFCVGRSGLSQSKIAEYVGISTSHCSRILQGNPKPSRDVALKFAFVLKLSKKETEHLLRITDNGELYVKNRRDAIIIYGLQTQKPLQWVQDSLFEYGEETLNSKAHD